MTSKEIIFAAVVLTAGVSLGRTIQLPSMPVSLYADTEVSTNLTINKADIGYYDLEFSLFGTPTNNLELAFGTDVNTNGVLDVEEVETRFGWRRGRYFVENALTWEMFNGNSSGQHQNFSINLHLEVKYDTQHVRKVTVSGVNVSDFGALVSDIPPAWIWRREWSLMRVTRRGVEPPSDWLEYTESVHGTVIRLR